MILPLTLDAAGLAKILPLKESTILRDVLRPIRADKLPPWISFGRKKIWLAPVALHWMAGEGQSLEYLGISVEHISPLLDVAQLAKLLYLREETVKLYVSQFPGRLPPAIANLREKRWVASVVLDWLVKRQNRVLETDFTGLIVSASVRNQQALREEQERQERERVKLDSLAGLVQTTMRTTGSGMGGMR